MPDEVRSRELQGCAEPECVDRALDLLQELWAECGGLGADDRMAFELAVVEVMANIVQHSVSADPVDVRLRVLVHPDRVEADFEDTGDDVHLPAPLHDIPLPDDGQETGRGLRMADAVLDELSHSRTGRTNHWRLVRRRRT